MSDFLQQYGIAMYISQDILIVPFQADFYEEVIAALRSEILDRLYTNTSIKGVIIDLSKVNLIDLENMRALEETMHMAHLLGVSGLLAGIQPNVTLTLIELGYEPTKVKSVLSIGQGVSILSKLKQQTQEQDSKGDDNTILTESDDI